MSNYVSPFSSRYASDYMSELFSSEMRIKTWRKLWIALAKAENELGLPITEAQLTDLEEHIDDIDFEYAAQKEKEFKHDVMAHIHAYGKVAPSAAGVIHLGATSCYVTDNADLVLYRDALLYIRKELLKVIANLCDFAEQYKDMPTLGYTHYQPAQMVTVGKRAALWLQDFVSDLDEVDFALKNIKFLGCRGTTGTAASFKELFEGDTEKINLLNQKIASSFGFEEIFDVQGQTYPRKLDSRILNALSSVAQSAHKFATDMRLLQHDRQLFEPFGKTQVGSSAMPYKRNPMMCERICSLSRYLMADALNAPMTVSVQWMERTLDDSANRRVSIPEGFLCCDAVLRLLQKVTADIYVNTPVIEKTVREYLPFIATENLMMEGVKRGKSRQELHEIIRQCSMKAIERMDNGVGCDLLDQLAAHPDFPLTLEEMNSVLNPADYTGISAEQTQALVDKTRPLVKDAERKNAQIDI
ncbi:MAG: adenylosuccinate lyase [Ruminococcus sp.]|nr:adenylosuccinate lyase [Ruminococcus sp.]